VPDVGVGGGGQAVADALAAGGVDTVFALCGGHVSPILEGCARCGIRIVTFRDERSAAFAAGAYGAIERRPGVCIVTAGPGFTNAVTGLAQAQFGEWPVLSIAGRFELSGEGLGALQEIDQEVLARPFSKLSMTARSPSRLVDVTERALRAAATRPYGHVHLSIPIDILTARVSAGMSSASVNSRMNAPDLSDEVVEEVLTRVRAAERPVCILGPGAWFAGGEAAVQELVAALPLPVFTNDEARGLIPDDHPLALGPLLYRQTGAADAVRDADFVLAVGIQPDWRVEQLALPLIGGGAAIVSIRLGTDATTAGARFIIDAIADEAKAMRAITKKAPGGLAWDSWVAHLKELNVRRREELLAQSDAAGALHPACTVMAVAAAAQRSDGNVVINGGNTGKWAKALIPARRPGQVLRLKGAFASIGHGLPSAIVRSLTDRGRPTFLVTGDGSFGYGIADLQTAVDWQAWLVAVVAVDRAWGSVQLVQQPIDGHYVGSELSLTRFDRVAEAFGAAGFWVEAAAELDDAIDAAVGAARPAVIAVDTVTAAGPATYPASVDYA
jgi:acetolactate synthase-1/2/3 large subunit